jgi:hypothetical protein
MLSYIEDCRAAFGIIFEDSLLSCWIADELNIDADLECRSYDREGARD